MYKKATLKNGLRLVNVSMPQVKSATALIMVAAGSRYESQKINGLSHFLEHMMFKGTKKRPSNIQVVSLIDSIGGVYNAFTGKDHTGFYVKAAAEHLETVLDVLSDMLQNSLFDQGEMDKERGVIIEEINMYEDQPQAMVGEYFEELLFPNSALGRKISGTKENIKSITREELVEYVNRMYHSGSIVLGVSGKLDELPKIKALGEKYLGTLHDGPENKFDEFKIGQTKPKSMFHYKKTDQAHLVLGVRGYPLCHPDRYVLAVIGTILGGNMSSRLFQEVRVKRGLAYYVYSGSDEYADTGYFASQAGLRIDAVEDAIKIILEEYKKIENGVSPEELRRAKDYWKGKMVLALEDSYRVASFYTSQELLEKGIETPEEIMEKVETITIDDVKRVAKDIFVDHKLNLAVVGPFKDEEKFNRLLRF